MAKYLHQYAKQAGAAKVRKWAEDAASCLIWALAGSWRRDLPDDADDARRRAYEYILAAHVLYGTEWADKVAQGLRWSFPYQLINRPDLFEGGEAWTVLLREAGRVLAASRPAFNDEGACI